MVYWLYVGRYWLLSSVFRPEWMGLGGSGVQGGMCERLSACACVYVCVSAVGCESDRIV